MNYLNCGKNHLSGGNARRVIIHIKNVDDQIGNSRQRWSTGVHYRYGEVVSLNILVVKDRLNNQRTTRLYAELL